MQLQEFGTFNRRLGLRRRLCAGLLYCLDQQLNVGVPSAIAELDGVAMRELDEVGRQILRGWHARPLDQHGDYPDAFALEGAGDFDPQIVVGAVETA